MIYTIRDKGEGEYFEKGSKFFSRLFPLKNKSELTALVDEVAKDIPNSKHICYAYRIGVSSFEEFSTDAGEPPHSAGDSILNQLRSHNLTNCLGIVARIYGGTKLGLSKLREAYSCSIISAISYCELIPEFEKNRILLKFKYDKLGIVEKIIALNQGIVLEKKFLGDCSFLIEFQNSTFQNVLSSLEDFAHHGLVYNELG